MNNIKTGWKTTEFRFTLVNVLVSIAGLVYLFATGQWEQFQALLTVLLGNSTVSTIAYGIIRTNLKKADLVVSSPLMSALDTAATAAEAKAVAEQSQG